MSAEPPRDPTVIAFFSEIVMVELSQLDALRGGSPAAASAPEAFAKADGAIAQMYATDDGGSLLVATTDGKLETFDTTTAERVGSVALAGMAGFASAGSGPAVTTLAGSVEDPDTVAATLAGIFGGDAATYKARLASTADVVILAGLTGSQQRRTQKQSRRALSAYHRGRPAGVVATADASPCRSCTCVISTTQLDGSLTVRRD